jgi:hypothetical protein
MCKHLMVKEIELQDWSKKNYDFLVPLSSFYTFAANWTHELLLRSTGYSKQDLTFFSFNFT